jgi:hypothetical protein
VTTRRAVILAPAAPLLSAQQGRGAPAEDTPLFSAYNIWYEKPNAIPSVNYKVGRMLSAGTPVRSAAVKGSQIAFVATDGAAYTVIFEAAKHPGMTIAEFKDRMLIPRNFAEMTREMTAVEVGCIRRGVVQPDLGKQAVLMAYGYPPEDQTPSVNSSIWQYSMSRSQTEAIRFDGNGMTTSTSAPVTETRDTTKPQRAHRLSLTSSAPLSLPILSECDKVIPTEAAGRASSGS